MLILVGERRLLPNGYALGGCSLHLRLIAAVLYVLRLHTNSRHVRDSGFVPEDLPQVFTNLIELLKPSFLKERPDSKLALLEVLLSIHLGTISSFGTVKWLIVLMEGFNGSLHGNWISIIVKAFILVEEVKWFGRGGGLLTKMNKLLVNLPLCVINKN